MQYCVGESLVASPTAGCIPHGHMLNGFRHKQHVHTLYGSVPYQALVYAPYYPTHPLLLLWETTTVYTTASCTMAQMQLPSGSLVRTCGKEQACVRIQLATGYVGWIQPQQLPQKAPEKKQLSSYQYAFLKQMWHAQTEPEQYARCYPFTWRRETTFVGITGQQIGRYRVQYWTMLGESCTGILETNLSHAATLEEFFAFLYTKRFPLAQIHSYTHFPRNSYLQLDCCNVTYSYSPRAIFGKKGWSKHADGCALDLNPLSNPYKKKGEHPYPHAHFLCGSKGVLTPTIIDFLVQRGWVWGGSWEKERGYADNHHFEKG